MYIQQILNLHAELHGQGPHRIRCAERRDAGVPRVPVSGRPGPETEAAFGRKREAAIVDVEAAPAAKRARMVRAATTGLRRILEAVAVESVVASAGVIARVAKRVKPVMERSFRGAEAAARARGQRDKKVAQSSKAKRSSDAASSTLALRPGVMLVRLHDKEARLKGLQFKFQVTTDPVDFVAKVIQVPASAGKGHVVLAPPVDTDFSLSAMIAVALMGGFFATPKEYTVAYGRLTQAAPPRGIAYTGQYKIANQKWHVAVSAAVAAEFPTLPQLLLSIAKAPGSGCNLYMSERKLCTFFKKASATTPRILQKTCVLAKPAERMAVKKKYRELYITPRGFLLKFRGTDDGVCPGWRVA